MMDDARPGTTFGPEGFCNYCTEYLGRTSRSAYQGTVSDEKLARTVEKIKRSGAGKKYDCIIGISGGIDSSYTAYMAKKLGLRALAVHMDNGWDSDISVRNIKFTVDKLGFEYESYVLDWQGFRDLQLAFLKASVPDMENPTDMAIAGALHRTAVKYGVKYIVSGGNYATEGFLPKYFQYDAKDAKYLRGIYKRFGSGKLKDFPYFGWMDELYFKLVKGLRLIYILNYMPYSKEEAISSLEREFGWRYYGGKHFESIYTRFVQGHILPEKFNVDYRKITLSMQVLNGERSHEDALRELSQRPYDEKKVQEDTTYVCKKLGIPPGEFASIMASPPKTYRDYPNDEKKLEWMYRTYGKLGSVFSN
jgi:N-acetyl sugar amidotransferase